MVYEGLRGQSAIEYLMTYGWMLLVVAVVGGAVFSVVDGQGIESVQGFNTQDVNVQDFGVSDQNGLMFSMSDPLGQTEVTEITVSNPDTTDINYVVNQDISNENTVNLPGITPSDNDNELEVEITYDTDNLENLKTTGTITGNLEADENFNNRTLILDGLIGYWPLNEEVDGEGRIVIDRSGNENHGKTINDVETDADGVFGTNAYGFQTVNTVEETSRVQKSEAISFGSENPVHTFSTWIRWDGGEQTDYEDSSRFVSPFGDSSTSGTIYLSSSSGTDSTYFRYRTNGGDDVRIANDELNWPEGDIIHLVWQITEDDELKVYENGDLVDSTTVGDHGEGVPYENFGWSGSGGSHYGWDGIIDEVKIYDRVLSEGEIETIYEQGDIE